MLSRLIGGVLATILVLSVGLNLYLGAALVSLTTGPTESVYLAGDASQRIVILPIEGLIDGGTAEFVRQALVELRDNRPKAVILRVDSGGGYVTPSDQIWNELAVFKAETGIPIVASFGSTAASGGYYVAAAADLIIAEPTCITGSIGVIAQAFTFDELLDKVGITPEVVVSSGSTKKDMLNPMRPWTEDDRAKLRTVLDNAYERFVEVVAQGRGATANLTIDDVRAIATGEVYTVDRAVALKLVDQEGYLTDAIASAKSRAGITAATPQVSRVERPRGFGLGGLYGASDAPALADVKGETVRSWLLELGVPAMLYSGSPAGR